MRHRASPPPSQYGAGQQSHTHHLWSNQIHSYQQQWDCGNTVERSVEYSNNKAGTHKSIVVLFSVEHFRSQAFIHGYGFVGPVVLYVCTGPRIVPDEQGSTLQGSSAMSTMK